MIFYHLSPDIHKDGLFIARAPDEISFFEDNMTERICVSTSIEGCLAAMPGGFLDERMKNSNSVLKLFRFDTEKLGILESQIYGPEKLLHDHLVPDALLTDEHWLLVDVEVPEEDISFIKINEYQVNKVSIFQAGTTPEIQELFSSSETIELVENLKYSLSSQDSSVHEFVFENQEQLSFMKEAAEGFVGKEKIRVEQNRMLVDFKNERMYIPTFYILLSLYEGTSIAA